MIDPAAVLKVISDLSLRNAALESQIAALKADQPKPPMAEKSSSA